MQKKREGKKNKKEKKTAGGDREGKRKDETGLISVILSGLNTAAAIWHQILHVSDGWMGPIRNLPAHFTTSHTFCVTTAKSALGL